MYTERSYIKLGKWVLILFTIIFLSSLIIKGPFKAIINFHFSFLSQGLSEIINHNLEGKDGDYAVFIQDLSDQEVFSLNSNNSFPAASLYKVYLLAAVLKEVKDGNLKLDDTLSSSKSYLSNTLGEVDFGYEDMPEEIEYSVGEAMERIGRVSDNFAAIMLMDKLGVEKVQNMADYLNADETEIKAPITTSASDMGKFFKKLARKEIMDLEISDKLIEFLSLNQLSSRIPALLPEGTKVVHKTGELARIRHDAGFVTLPNGKVYVIVFMSQNLRYEDEAIETMAQISKDVYDYFADKYSN